MQTEWRWCRKCQGLAFSLNQPSVCPAGGSHDHSESGNYALVLDDPSAQGQSDWRWCKKCQGLAFSLNQPSVCPAGASHDHSQSGNYTLRHNDPLAPGQSEWRWCRKCQGLAFSLNQPSVCPAGGSHDHSESGNYTLAFESVTNAGDDLEEPYSIVELSGSVGRNGQNKPEDVMLVQTLLNAVPVAQGGPPQQLQVDGKSGEKTVGAIQGFQLKHFGWNLADGRVDQIGPTWQMLTNIISQIAPDLLRVGSGMGTRSPMLVGFNYPWAWNQSGLYFGAGKPPGSNPAYDRWIGDLRTNLRLLKTDLNITHIRIFLLCSAWNYGDITSAPPPTLPLIGTTLHTTGRDRFTPPPSLLPKYTDHLKKMLDAFRAEEMFVLPSLVDHRCFRPESLNHPTNYGAGGRAEIITNSGLRSIFLTQVLDEFLKVSGPYFDNIDAWEVVSEPIWNVSRLYGAAHAYWKMGSAYAPDADVADVDMVKFISSALSQIEGLRMPGGRRFKSSVGHRFYSDLSSPMSNGKPLPSGTVRQFHYYPQSYTIPALPGMAAINVPYTDPPKLPTFAESNAWIGEFSCQLPGHGEGDAWPELNGADTLDVRTAVHERLRLLNRKGYPIAYVWPDLSGATFPGRDDIKLSSHAQEGIKRYNASPW